MRVMATAAYEGLSGIRICNLGTVLSRAYRMRELMLVALTAQHRLLLHQKVFLRRAVRFVTQGAIQIGVEYLMSVSFYRTALDLRMTGEARVGLLGLKHFLVERSVRIVTGQAEAFLGRDMRVLALGHELGCGMAGEAQVLCRLHQLHRSSGLGLGVADLAVALLKRLMLVGQKQLPLLIVRVGIVT